MSYSIKISILGLLAYSITSTILFAQIPCINGKSGTYDCKDVTFLSNVTAQQLLAENTSGVWLNDIWGWVDDQSQKEYAIVAMSNGTTFVDVSDPLNPLVLGILPEHASASTGRAARSNSIWRDVKTFKNHAFIVSEDSDHGMQIFDLTKLRNVANPPEVFPETAHYAGISNAHNIVINEATGFAYAVGATRGGNCKGGELHIIDINNPIEPVYAGCFDSNSYTHDAQCIIYNGPDLDYAGKELCFNANQNTIKVVNVDDKDNPVLISSFSYSGVQYAHQGWLTDDRKYFISNDELDELNNGTKTKTFVWDVQDLDKPILISTYTHDGNAIDHNLYCKDNLIFQSNYNSGLRILGLNNITTTGLEEVAFFDSYPANNNTDFQGTWSNYPFFPSGNIILSDIKNGLFVLKYEPTNVEAENIAPQITTQAYLIDEFSTEGTQIASIYSFDRNNDVLNYSITAGNTNDAFVIDTSTGNLAVSKSTELDSKTNPVFTLTIEVSDGKLNTSATVTIMIRAIKETQITSINNLNEDNISIYPNPVKNSLNILFSNVSSNVTIIELYDFSGKKLLKSSEELIDKKEVSINTSSFKKGIYHIRITYGNKSVSKKVVIQ